MASILSKVKQAYQLFQHIDLDKLNHLAAKVDLGEVINSVSKMDDKQLAMVMKMLTQGSKPAKPMPPIEADFYHLSHTLNDEERKVQLRVREFMETEVRPIVNQYWLKAQFPFELIPKIAALNVCGYMYKGYGCPGSSYMLDGILAMEMARIDTSMATFFGYKADRQWVPFICWVRKNKNRNGYLICSSLKRSALSV